MNSSITFGSAFGAKLRVHSCWLWLLPLAALTFVWLQIEPPLEAIVASLLLFGSVFLSVVTQLWTAQRNGLRWEQVTLFPLGGVVERTHRSTPLQEANIAMAGLSVHAVLGVVFGLLWLWLPDGALGIEMEIVALFNMALFFFSFFLRLSPNHDNLLHAAFASAMNPPHPRRMMRRIHAGMLMLYAVSGIVLLKMSWLAFGWWFLVTVLLSQIATVAEQQGEYRDDMPSANVITDRVKGEPQRAQSTVPLQVRE